MLKKLKKQVYLKHRNKNEKRDKKKEKNRRKKGKLRVLQKRVFMKREKQ